MVRGGWMIGRGNTADSTASVQDDGEITNMGIRRQCVPFQPNPNRILFHPLADPLIHRQLPGGIHPVRLTYAYRAGASRIAASEANRSAPPSAHAGRRKAERQKGRKAEKKEAQAHGALLYQLTHNGPMLPNTLCGTCEAETEDPCKSVHSYV